MRAIICDRCDERVHGVVTSLDGKELCERCWKIWLPIQARIDTIHREFWRRTTLVVAEGVTQ